jgi:hypothetical protein
MNLQTWAVTHFSQMYHIIFRGRVHIYHVYIIPYLHYLLDGNAPLKEGMFWVAFFVKHVDCGKWGLSITLGFWGDHRYLEMRTVHYSNKWNFAFGWWKKPSTWNYCARLQFLTNFWTRKSHLIKVCDLFSIKKIPELINYPAMSCDCWPQNENTVSDSITALYELICFHT